MIPDDKFYDRNGNILSCRALGVKLGISKSAANRLIGKFKAKLAEQNAKPHAGKDETDYLLASEVNATRLTESIAEVEATQKKDRFIIDPPKPKQRNILVLNDIHFPYHDEKTLESIMYYVYDTHIDMIVLNGDTLDCESLSVFNDPNRGALSAEIDVARRFIKQLTQVARRNNSECEFVWIDGNHEARLDKYLSRQAPELAGLTVDGANVLSIRSLMGLDSLGWQYIPYTEYLELPGNLFIEHGHKVSKHSSNSVGNAIRDNGGSIIVGHVHRLGAFYVTNRLGTFRGFENGCLCLAPKYMPKDTANWQQGFCKITYTDVETWHVQQVFIQNSSFFVDGKLYG